MGYNPEFLDNTHVRIADREHLEEFKRNWRYHHPLTEEQLDYAGRTALVKSARLDLALRAGRARAKSAQNVPHICAAVHH